MFTRQQLGINTFLPLLLSMCHIDILTKMFYIFSILIDFIFDNL